MDVECLWAPIDSMARDVAVPYFTDFILMPRREYACMSTTKNPHWGQWPTDDEAATTLSVFYIALPPWGTAYFPDETDLFQPWYDAQTAWRSRLQAAHPAMDAIWQTTLSTDAYERLAWFLRGRSASAVAGRLRTTERHVWDAVMQAATLWIQTLPPDSASESID